MKSWKTTLLGLLTVGVSLAPQIIPTLPAKWQGLAGALAGVGLLLAKDSNVSGPAK